MKPNLSRRLPALLAGGALLFALSPLAAEEAAKKVEVVADPAANTFYAEKIRAWQEERVQGMKQEDGWLTLVGLFWLDEGENRFGTDPGNKVIFPEGKGLAVAGTLIRRGDKVSVKAAPGSGLTSQGKPVTEMELRVDTAGEPTVLELGTLSFFAIQRGDRIGARIKDRKAPQLVGFKGLDFYPVQTAWRVEARFEPYTPPKKVAVPNVLGQVTDSDSPGAVVFEKDGRTWRLDTLGSVDKGLSLIFADGTNGHETYGAGRFLEIEGQPKDGRIMVDFNTAYNPPCAYTAFATCPLPPAQNKLALKVEAGEKKFGDGSH
ncbi:MAG TPA: DUF1684 domain-containing protein [Thermoanaerobaculia bacterium]|nr:DUF1684 domain-containing protein [Thermoanaerobaculia bacterium]